jgi:hypothetical protein
VQDQTGGVGLGIAADDQDFLTHLGQSRQGVLGGGGLANPTLAVKSDLPQCAHLFLLRKKLKNPVQFAAVQPALFNAYATTVPSPENAPQRIDMSSYSPPRPS